MDPQTELSALLHEAREAREQPTDSDDQHAPPTALAPPQGDDAAAALVDRPLDAAAQSQRDDGHQPEVDAGAAVDTGRTSAVNPSEPSDDDEAIGIAIADSLTAALSALPRERAELAGEQTDEPADAPPTMADADRPLSAAADPSVCFDDPWPGAEPPAAELDQPPAQDAGPADAMVDHPNAWPDADCPPPHWDAPPAEPWCEAELYAQAHWPPADADVDQGEPPPLLAEGPESVPPRPTASPAQPAPAAATTRTVTVYVDADNQLPDCAHALMRMLQEDLMLGPVRAVVAGNNCNGRLDGWCAEIRWTAPAMEVERIHVPTRKQAADVALIMALGANLAEHVARRDLIVIVSRDESLIGAAEWAKAQGAGCLTAYGNGTPPASPAAPLPTLVLPVLEREQCPPPAPPPRAEPPATPAPTTKLPPTPSFARPGGATRAKSRTSGRPPEEIIKTLRLQCPLSPKGGYPAGMVGHVLAKLGLNDKERRAFLTQTPGIQVAGKGPDKRYIL